jgi:cell division protein FtsN
MKWLFFILLIANLALFIWVFPQQDGAPRSERPKDIGQLLLVGELQEQEPAFGMTQEDTYEPQPPTAAFEAEPQISPAVTELDVPEATEPQTPVVIEPGAAVATEPAVLSEPPSTAMAEEEGAVDEAVPPETLPSPEPLDEPMCGRIGMFEKRSQAELLSVLLLAKGGKTDITSETSNEQAGFWVLIPAQPNRGAAINVAKRLKAAGVADLWRFTSGALAHAISLGLFRNRERAEVRRSEVAKLGFKPEVRPRYRELTRFWLNYRYTGETLLTEPGWQQLKQQYPELERVEEPCS